jgi:hypothetical protein
VHRRACIHVALDIRVVRAHRISTFVTLQLGRRLKIIRIILWRRRWRQEQV